MQSHFQKRCLQRLGYIPNMKDLVALIQKGRLEFYERQSNRVTVWRWVDQMHGVKCLLPYDKERKQIITILFEDKYVSYAEVKAFEWLSGEEIECL